MDSPFLIPDLEFSLIHRFLFSRHWKLHRGSGQILQLPSTKEVAFPLKCSLDNTKTPNNDNNGLDSLNKKNKIF